MDSFFVYANATRVIPNRNPELEVGLSALAEPPPLPLPPPVPPVPPVPIDHPPFDGLMVPAPPVEPCLAWYSSVGKLLKSLEACRLGAQKA